MNNPLTVDIRDIMPPFHLNVSVRVKGTWRIKVAARLIRLASWVLGTEMVLAFPEMKD